MLKFALPTLGIYLADPLMSNIDNGFVGRLGGTQALAALGPGATLSNSVLFLFGNILNSATTGLVSRAWATDGGENKEAAKAELARTLSFGLLVGGLLTAAYVFLTPWALGRIGTPLDILPQAASYVQIRGLVAWAVLSQGCCLSAILATREAMTPLYVIALAAVLNFAGDWLFCYWPFQWSVAGAAAATALSQLASFGLMLRALGRKGIAPTPRLPRLEDVKPLMEYAGPLFVVVTARVLGFSLMQISAARIGTEALAAYQVLITVFTIFAFVSAPLSQIAQSILPPIVDRGDSGECRRACLNIIGMAVPTAFVVSGICFLTLHFGATLFTSDLAVLSEVYRSTFAIFLAAATLLVSSAIDGALLAAKDFSFIIPAQLSVCAFQCVLLYLVNLMGGGLPEVLLTFSIRLWCFLLLALGRILLGKGPLGRVLLPAKP